MEFKRTKRTALVAALGGVLAFTGACDDLEVQNPNAPDRSRALATPGDVASLIAGSYLNYFQVQQDWNDGTAVAMGSMADQISSSWGNVGMQDFGKEPRNPIPNDPQYVYNYVMENAWFNAYGAIVAASDGLRSMEQVEAVGDALGARERAFAKLGQGLGLGLIAVQFDKGFIVDETTDLSVDQEFVGYEGMLDAALAKLQETADIAASNSFTLPDHWINGNPMSSDRLNRYAHSQMARFIAQLPRTPSEAGNADWGAVINHVDQGIQQDLDYQGETTGPWWAGMKIYGAWSDGFVRSDYRDIGPADQSGQYQAWEATPPEQRQPFDMETPDRRITGDEGPESRGLYKHYAGPSPFPPARGTYYFSNYGDHRYDNYAPFHSGPIPEMSTTEMDLYKAEAYIRTGQEALALPLINNTRVGNGELPPATTAGATGPNCVPKTIEGNCGDLMEVLAHERRMELYQLSGGMPYYDDRRFGKLHTGTAFHFPVPGAELQVLQEEIYTYGGVGGDAAAPSAAPLPGDEDFDVLERVKYSLDALEKLQDKWSERGSGVTRQ